MKKNILLSLIMLLFGTRSYAGVIDSTSNHIQAFDSICYMNKTQLNEIDNLAAAMKWKKEIHEYSDLLDMQRYTNVTNNNYKYSIIVQDELSFNMCNLYDGMSQYNDVKDKEKFVVLLKAKYPIMNGTSMLDRKTVSRLMRGNDPILENILLDQQDEQYSWFDENGYLISVHFIPGQQDNVNTPGVRTTYISLIRF